MYKGFWLCITRRNMLFRHSDRRLPYQNILTVFEPGFVPAINYKVASTIYLPRCVWLGYATSVSVY
jgi:hypothetical protein